MWDPSESPVFTRVSEKVAGHLSPREVDVDGDALVHLLVHALLLFLPRRRLRHGGGKWNNKRPRSSNRLRTHVYVVIMCAGCAHKRVRAQRIVALIIITSDHILVIYYDDKRLNDSTATTKQLTSIINVRVQGYPNRWPLRHMAQTNRNFARSTRWDSSRSRPTIARTIHGWSSCPRNS